MERTKIGIFMEFYLPYLGGIERYIDRLSAQLRHLGYDVFIVTSLFDESLPRFEERDGMRVYRLPTKGLFKQRYPFFKRDARFKETMARVEAEAADFYIVNTRFHLTSLLGARLAKRQSKPVALIEHGTAHMSVGSKVLDFFGGIYEHGLTHFVKRNVTSYYGVSKNCNKWLRHFRIEASGVWYNAVNPDDAAKADDRFEDRWPRSGAQGARAEEPSSGTDPVREAPAGGAAPSRTASGGSAPDGPDGGAPERAPIVISYAGRLIAEKGVVALLEAFTRVRDSHPDLDLVLAVAGSGPIGDQLRAEYGDSAGVEFLGTLDFPAVMSLYRRTDVFVYPSLYPEGLPTSILEAGLMGCAVIATPRGGTEEVIIDPEHGWVVDGSSSAELADALTTALTEAVEDPVRRAACAAAVQRRVREVFTWQSVAREVSAVVEEAVSR